MSVTDEAVGQIKRMIVAGELAPGSRLPNQEDLAERLGLSRASLREAVRSLTTMNILVSRQGDGTYVSSLRTSLLLEPLAFAADLLHDDDVPQLLDLRVALEPHAVALAVGRIGGGEIEDLALLNEPLAGPVSAAEFVEADLEFHRRLLRLSGNDTLASLVNAISPPSLYARLVDDPPAAELRTSTYEDHARILRALADRDVDSARAAVAVHVNDLRRRLRAAMAS